MACKRVSYVVDACDFTVDTHNKFSSFGLLSSVLLAIDFSSHNVALGVVKRARESRQDIRPMNLVFCSHGDDK
jgi:hypothetical protein